MEEFEGGLPSLDGNDIIPNIFPFGSIDIILNDLPITSSACPLPCSSNAGKVTPGSSFPSTSIYPPIQRPLGLLIPQLFLVYWL
jgi:hypothetical protein